MLPPALMQELSRRRLGVRTARASRGVGERPSRAKGAGLEFAEHRPYQPGDDIRSLDAQASARLGVPIVREYQVQQQLPVLIVLDAGPGMALGRPAKFGLARALAGALAYTALAGGDVVQVLTFGDGVQLSPRLHGQSRATELLAWLAARRVGGGTTLRQAAEFIAPRTPKGALALVLSDLLAEDSPRALRPLHARSAEVVALHILSPEEREPARLGRGPVRLLEAGAGADGPGSVVHLDDATCNKYVQALESWTAALSQELVRHGGQLIGLRSDVAVEAAVAGELARRGVIV